MYNITITDSADQELSEILDYLSVQLQNPAAATAFVKEVLSVYEALKHTPNMYELSHNLRLHRMGYRFLVYKDYLLFYQYQQAENTVYITAVFNGKLDYMRVMKKYL